MKNDCPVIKVYPFPKTPAHDRKGLAPSGRYARQFGLLLLANLYRWIHLHTGANVYAYTYAYA